MDVSSLPQDWKATITVVRGRRDFSKFFFSFFFLQRRLLLFMDMQSFDSPMPAPHSTDTETLRYGTLAALLAGHPSLASREVAPVMQFHEPERAQALEHDVKINRQTTISAVAKHPLGTLVEYPETTAKRGNYIAHVFDVDATKSGEATRKSVCAGFLYSRSGYGGGAGVKLPIGALIGNKDLGEVDCTEHHFKCKYFYVANVSIPSLNWLTVHAQVAATSTALRETQKSNTLCTHLHPGIYCVKSLVKILRA